jgi:hypothetical protein
MTNRLCTCRLVVGALVYLAGGVSYLRFVKGHRGTDQIPNYEFWMQVPSRAKVRCACFNGQAV